jgi:iron complex transport system ATP-binding protein
MIALTSVTCAYGKKVVISDFSAHLPSGSITAITGPNGSGKSTLLAAIAGDIESALASIQLNGKLLSQYSLKDLASIRSVVSQSHYYWLSYTVREIIGLGNGDVDTHRVEDVCKRLGIEPYLEQNITTLSGGQLQRVEIARALVRPTSILLLDEPFASQDLASIKTITDVLINERESGRTIVLVAHSRETDLQWCDQIINLDPK